MKIIIYFLLLFFSCQAFSIETFYVDPKKFSVKPCRSGQPPSLSAPGIRLIGATTGPDGISMNNNGCYQARKRWRNTFSAAIAQEKMVLAKFRGDLLFDVTVDTSDLHKLHGVVDSDTNANCSFITSDQMNVPLDMAGCSNDFQAKIATCNIGGILFSTPVVCPAGASANDCYAKHPNQIAIPKPIDQRKVEQ